MTVDEDDLDLLAAMEKDEDFQGSTSEEELEDEISEIC